MIEYKIFKSVYEDIVSEIKTMEIRLLNDKAKKIKIGDKIKFQVLNGDNFLIVEIADVHIYDNIAELWKNKDIILKCARNYTKSEFTNALYEIFGEEEVLDNKIVGLEFKVLEVY